MDLLLKDSMTFGRFSRSQSISVVTSYFYKDPFDIPLVQSFDLNGFAS